MRTGNVWLVCSDALIADYRWDGEGTDPMTPEARAAVNELKTHRNAGSRNEWQSYLHPNTKIYRLFSVYGSRTLRDDIDLLLAEYPNDCFVGGAWWFDNGLQIGTQYAEDGETIEGDPLYPIHPQLWRLVPEALSNADLRDCNLLQGQAPRQFT